MAGLLTTNLRHRETLTTGLAVAILLPDIHYELLVSVRSCIHVAGGDPSPESIGAGVASQCGYKFTHHGNVRGRRNDGESERKPGPSTGKGKLGTTHMVIHHRSL